MTLEPLPIPGAYLVTGNRQVDHRGSFSKLLSLQLLRKVGFDLDLTQLFYAENLQAGTIRGLHYQIQPFQERKLLWCVAGRFFDVLVDLRSEMPTFGQWLGMELSAEESCAVIVPPGVAHGYQSLLSQSTMAYLIEGVYLKEYQRSLNWSDPTVGVAWPMTVSEISDRDAMAPGWPPQYC